MKPWRDCSTEEKLDRLACAIHICIKRIPKAQPIPGYDIVEIGMTLEGEDDWLGVYGGNLTKDKAA